jgi:DNA-directed RNA polymerase specialized sigma subunit
LWEGEEVKTELELIREAQAGSTKAANKLCKMHTGFIRLVASKYHISGLEYDDVVQLCYDGLLKAIKDYDLNSGIKLISYSIYKIRGVVSRRAADFAKLKRCANVCSLDAHFQALVLGDGSKGPQYFEQPQRFD